MSSSRSYLPVLLLSLFLLTSSENADKKETNNLLQGIQNEDLLILSTLDGSLYGIDRGTGDVRWKLANEPTVKVPVNIENAIVPLFLPDPKDGSLYLFNSAEDNILKKLPFSIQQLVASSPCRSNDGIFYTGKKIDSWLSIDWRTGKKTSFVSFNELEKTCPIQSPESVFIGKTEYKILMYDSKSTNKHWNVTFFDYSSLKLPNDLAASYYLLHMGSTSSGRVRTWNPATGYLMWEKDFGSPMVALYTRLGRDLVKLPFTSVAESTFDALPSFQKLHSTLYIGEHGHGLYALPSLAGQDVPLISESSYSKTLLIEGPDVKTSSLHPIILGHYILPETIATHLQITGSSDPVISTGGGNSTGRRVSLKPAKEPAPSDPKHQPVDQVYVIVLFALLLIIILVGFCIVFHLWKQVYDIKYSSSGSAQGSNGSTGVKYIEQSQYGEVFIGKISFNTQHILGKGCEGTFVFKGSFDGRSVAVKRLLPDCFTVADREVKLLRESDAHPNVIRYFSMEEDSQFRYIALELCSATLQEYVENGQHKNDISPRDVLKQASNGLEHLHSLKIVHRDIKPHNILLCANGALPKVRVMISDFGLCKKLQHGCASFSRKSGITGTVGWIAPEILEKEGRATCAVDIFSLGCVFYYTLSNAKHPFGDPLRRQMNILSGEYRLSAVRDNLWSTLIEKMISQDPRDRPSMAVIVQHPVFWDKARVLTFLQDVSDRCEKEGVESEALLNLEMGGSGVCQGDWKSFIDPEVAYDLGKYRSYRGDSVRDLLRALRNKKHHYRELPLEAQNLLGHSVESYTDYWTSRFPTLLYHSWSSLQFLKAEPNFSHYYPSSYTFPCSKSEELPDWFVNFDKAGTEKSKHKSPQKAKKPRDTKGEPEKAEPCPEKEAWIKKGKENGAWRPNQVRLRKKEKKKLEADGIVWMLPTQ